MATKKNNTELNTTPESLEQAFEMLESTIANLENPELNLEESFAEYSKGMELVKFANAAIDKVEKQVQMLSENGELTDFE